MLLRLELVFFVSFQLAFASVDRALRRQLLIVRFLCGTRQPVSLLVALLIACCHFSFSEDILQISVSVVLIIRLHLRLGILDRDFWNWLKLCRHEKVVSNCLRTFVEAQPAIEPDSDPVVRQVLHRRFLKF